jgi:hypothetical protein
VAGFDGNWSEERSNISTRLADIKESLDELKHAYFGNGKPGIVVRLDRLEEELKGRTWRKRALWAALIAALTANAVAIVRAGAVGNVQGSVQK